MTKDYICPICDKGNITIEQERTGPPGFRDTDYNILQKTCECITYNCDAVAVAIQSYKDKKYIKEEVCEKCGVEEATINFFTSNGYKNICSSCFEVEMKNLETKYSKS